MQTLPYVKTYIKYFMKYSKKKNLMIAAKFFPLEKCNRSTHFPLEKCDNEFVFPLEKCKISLYKGKFYGKSNL